MMAFVDVFLVDLEFSFCMLYISLSGYVYSWVYGVWRDLAVFRAKYILFGLMVTISLFIV